MTQTFALAPALTRTQAAARGALVVLATLAFGLMALLLMPNPGTQAQVVDTPAVEFQRIDAIPVYQSVAVELVPGADLTPEQVALVEQTADLICEGFTAGVPVVNMADSLVWNFGLTDTEARDFVNQVGNTHC